MHLGQVDELGRGQYPLNPLSDSRLAVHPFTDPGVQKSGQAPDFVLPQGPAPGALGEGQQMVQGPGAPFVRRKRPRRFGRSRRPESDSQVRVQDGMGRDRVRRLHIARQLGGRQLHFVTPIGETAVAGHAPRLSEPAQVQVESRQVANRVVVFEGSQLPQAGIAGPGRFGGHPFFQSPLVPHGEEFPFLFGRLVLLGRMGHGAGGEGPRHVAPGLVPLPQFLVEPLLHALLKVQASFPGRIVVATVAVVLQKGMDVLLELQLGGGSLQLGIGHGRFGGILRRKFRRFRPGGRPVDPVRQQGDLFGRGPRRPLGGMVSGWSGDKLRRRIRRLPAEFPAIITRPLSLPRRAFSSRSRRRPPCELFSPWQLWQ